jgi:hydrogenase maturation protein HypF
VVAVKSLGGFQLACDATNDQAVRRLRRRKNRPAKPLALMCDNTAILRGLVRVGRPATELLGSAAAPIVLLPKLAKPKPTVSARIAPRNPHLGVMLSYTPLHMALFRSFRSLTGNPGVLVMTSANRRDEPIAVSEGGLFDQLVHVFDLVLTHNRPIANRCDDSVVLGGPPHIMIRRARGYAPQPIRLSRMFHVKRPVLAVGADIKTSFVLAHGGRAFVSPHIGSLESPEAASFFLDTLARYQKWTGIKPAVIACDLHPDYLSTRLAEQLAEKLNAPLVRVQHHHAHVTSVMAEHAVPGPVLGIACDGTGYGTDGAIWGCEFLLVRQDLSWARLGHLGYLRLSGAGAEVADPIRVARAYLLQAQRVNNSVVRRSVLPPGRLPGTRTSSLGRLFDAVAAITGACRAATFDGEAAVALEAIAALDAHGDYVDDDLLDLAFSPAIVRPEPLIRAVSRETCSGIRPAIVSARFHNTLAKSFARLAHRICRDRNIRTVCLSGGSFQNSRLRTQLSARLRRLGHQVYFNQLVPLNDGGVALGQMVVAGRTFPD